MQCLYVAGTTVCLRGVSVSRGSTIFIYLSSYLLNSELTVIITKEIIKILAWPSGLGHWCCNSEVLISRPPPCQ